MTFPGSGHVDRLPGGSLRVSVFAGRDSLTGRQLWHRKTVRTEREAQIALGQLMEQADTGRKPDSRVTVAELIARYMEVVELEVSTRQTYEGYIPAHDPARPGFRRGAEGSRARTGHALRAASALREPGVQRQAVHWARRLPAALRHSRCEPSMAASRR